MPFQLYARYCVGAPLKPEPARTLHDEFLASLGLSPEASAEDVFARLRDDTPKHKLHEPDRVRYELALEAFIDEKWSVDCAIGGLSPDGLFEPRRGYLFVGVRVEQYECSLPAVPTKAAAPDRPQWLRKGDLAASSELGKTLGPEAKKPADHVARMYQRASKEILKDAVARTKELPLSPQHEPDWALCRWLVDEAHPSVLTRHGNRSR